MKIVFLLVFGFLYSVFGITQSNNQSPEGVVQEKEGEQVIRNKGTGLLKEQNQVRSSAYKKVELSSKQQQQFALAAQNFNSLYSGFQRNNYAKTFSSKQVSKMNQELEKMEQLNAISFDYQLNNYLIGQHDFSKINSLKMASEWSPQNEKVQLQWIAYHFIMKNYSNLIASLKSIEQSNYFNTELYWYAKDVLSGLPKNAVLVTHGYADSYPILVQQYIYNHRKDVKIINLDFLTNKEMRQNLTKEGWKIPSNTTINTAFLAEFIALNPLRIKDIFISMTVPQTYFNEIVKPIEIVGLSFALASSASNENINSSFVKSVLNNSKPNGWTSTEGKRVKANYLLSFIKAYQDCTSCTTEEKNKYKEVILDLAKRTNKESEISTLIAN